MIYIRASVCFERGASATGIFMYLHKASAEWVRSTVRREVERGRGISFRRFYSIGLFWDIR